jgi:hypothetical protein
MKPRLIALQILLLATSPSVFADDSAAESDAPAEKLDSLIAEFEETGGAAQFAERFFEFEEQYRDDPAAVSALAWVLKNRRTSPDAVRAIEIIEAHHLENDALGPLCVSLARVRSTAGERLLRAILEKNTHADVQAQACYWLAYLLEDQQRIAGEFRKQPELADRMLQYYGKEYGGHLSSLDPAELDQELEAVYETMVDSYAHVAIDDESMGEIAERALFRIRNLSIGCVAPEIEGEDMHGETFKLSDYRGKVVVITFWGFW